MSDFHSWWTVAVLVVFLAIVIWAWSGRRHEDFEQAARIPLDDDEPLLEPGRARPARGANKGSGNG